LNRIEQDINILVVDDSAETLKAYGAILEKRGYCLFMAESGFQALKTMMEHEFAAILLDVRMPEMDGFETARLIRKNDRFVQTPIIFISGAACSSEDFQKGLEIGAVDYLLKPIGSQLLLAKVELLVQLWRQKSQINREKKGLYLLVNNNPDPMLVVNLRGVVRYVNQAALSTFGNEMLGEKFGVPAGDKLYIVDIITKDGRKVTHQVKRNSIIWQEEDAYLLVFRDITELKKIEEELRSAMITAEQANAAKSVFLSNISHELRTPLNSLLILSDILKNNKEGNLTGEQVGFAEIIHDAGSDLLGMIDDLLDLSKLEAGKMEVHKENINLDGFVGGLKREFAALVEKKSLAFHTFLDADLPEIIHADPQKIALIVRNFLSNAVKFTSHGEIRLEVMKSPIEINFSSAETPDQDFIAFVVSDTGIGVAETKQEAVFDKFVQEDNRTEKLYGGTGLGLALVRETSLLLGGAVDLKSRKGEGSTITFCLPLEAGTAGMIPRKDGTPDQPENTDKNRREKRGNRRKCDRRKGVRGRRTDDYLAAKSKLLETPLKEEGKAKAAKEKNRSEAALHVEDFPSLQGKKVLLVGQEMRLVYSLKNVFNRFEIETCYCAIDKEGLNELDKKPDLDIILMDILPLEMNWHAAIAAIKDHGRFSALPVFAFVAAEMGWEKEKCKAAGFDGFFVKPIDVNSLLKTMSEGTKHES